MPILQIRDENGNFVSIPAVKGDDGKSAYEQAKEGGYTGTEEEFISLLNNLTAREQIPTSELQDHLSDTNKHITQDERNNWNKNIEDLAWYKSTAANNFVTLDAAITQHKNDTTKHITQDERNGWNNKADSGHTHDDRYYTETEVDTKLSGKAPISHTHTQSQITDFPTSMPASDVYSWAKQPNKPSYTASEVGAATTFTKNVTVSYTGWTEVNGYYFQRATCQGILATDTPIVDVITSNDVDANELLLEAWSHVFRITTEGNIITVLADELVMTTNFQIQVKVVR